MITNKQRALLRGMANKLEPILLVGKDGINDNLIVQADEALTARELIKCSVLQNCPLTAREASDEICERTGAYGIQCIGRRFVLYRRNDEKPQIQI